MSRLSVRCTIDSLVKSLRYKTTLGQFMIHKGPGMPKHSKVKQKAEKASSTIGTEKFGNNEAVVENNNKTVTIKVLAKPGAKHNTVTGITEEGVGIQIAAPPVDGEANTELIKFLSKLLGLRKSDVSLDKGSKSRNKNIIVSGIEKDVLLKKLKEEIDGK
ncbi:hypothetical protein ScPMuIL_018073 [Solemya velum]